MYAACYATTPCSSSLLRSVKAAAQLRAALRQVCASPESSLNPCACPNAARHRFFACADYTASTGGTPSTAGYLWLVQASSNATYLTYFYDASPVLLAVAAPVPAVAGGPNLVGPAGAPTASALIHAAGSVCTSAPCTYGYTVQCPGNPPVFKNGSTTANISIGPSASYDINMRNVSSDINCTYSVAVTDSYSTSNTYSGVLRVGLCSCNPGTHVQARAHTYTCMHACAQLYTSLHTHTNTHTRARARACTRKHPHALLHCVCRLRPRANMIMQIITALAYETACSRVGLHPLGIHLPCRCPGCGFTPTSTSPGQF